MTTPAWLLIIAALSGYGAYLVRNDFQIILWLPLCVWSAFLGLVLLLMPA
jgi:hypothetical protein